MNLHDAANERLAPRIINDWRSCCSSFSTISLTDKTLVYRQGQACSHIYYVVSGCVKLAALDTNGHTFIRSILRRGEFFGAIVGQPRQRTEDFALTKGAVRLYRSDSGELNALLEAQPSIARCLLANLTERLSFSQRRTEHILFSPISKRVALILRELVGRYGGRCRHGHEIDIHLTQQELAEVVGASRPVISTVLNDLRQRGIVSYTRAFICIDSMASLEQLLN